MGQCVDATGRPKAAFRTEALAWKRLFEIALGYGHQRSRANAPTTTYCLLWHLSKDPEFALDPGFPE